MGWIGMNRCGTAQGRSVGRNTLDPYYSQYHDMQWIDIDGDGQPELVTGKRHRAHCGGDPAKWDDMNICYFKWNGESFTKCLIDFARICERPAGVGIFFATADLRGTAASTWLLPGKMGCTSIIMRGTDLHTTCPVKHRDTEAQRHRRIYCVGCW